MNGYTVPENFYLMSPPEQWSQCISACDISDNTSLHRILSSPMPILSLKAIFPNAAQSGAFSDPTKLTMQLRNLRSLEESLRSDATGPTRGTKQLERNNLKIKDPVAYPAEVDDMDTQIHSRLWANLPVTEPSKIYQMMAEKNIQPRAHNSYKLSHINGAGCVTNKGWVEAHNLGSTVISLKDFCRKNYIKANSGAARRWKAESEEGENVFEVETKLEDIEDLSEFFEAWCMCRLIKKRACPIDPSLEPLERFLAKHCFFISSKEKPDKMNPGRFCAGFCDYVMQTNGARFASGEPFLHFNQLPDQLKDFQMPYLRAEKTDNANGGGGGGGNGGGGGGAGGSGGGSGANRGGPRSRGAQRPNNPGPSNGGVKLDPPCKFYNSAQGCNYSTGSYCEWNNQRYMHICNVKEGSKVCRQKHPAAKHTKSEK